MLKKVGDSWMEFTGDEAVIAGDLSELADGEAVALVPDESPGRSAVATMSWQPRTGAKTAADKER